MPVNRELVLLQQSQYIIFHFNLLIYYLFDQLIGSGEEDKNVKSLQTDGQLKVRWTDGKTDDEPQTIKIHT